MGQGQYSFPAVRSVFFSGGAGQWNTSSKAKVTEMITLINKTIICFRNDAQSVGGHTKFFFAYFYK